MIGVYEEHNQSCTPDLLIVAKASWPTRLVGRARCGWLTYDAVVLGPHDRELTLLWGRYDQCPNDLVFLDIGPRGSVLIG